MKTKPNGSKINQWIEVTPNRGVFRWGGVNAICAYCGAVNQMVYCGMTFPPVYCKKCNHRYGNGREWPITRAMAERYNKTVELIKP